MSPMPEAIGKEDEGYHYEVTKREVSDRTKRITERLLTIKKWHKDLNLIFVGFLYDKPIYDHDKTTCVHPVFKDQENNVLAAAGKDFGQLFEMKKPQGGESFEEYLIDWKSTTGTQKYTGKNLELFPVESTLETLADEKQIPKIMNALKERHCKLDDIYFFKYRLLQIGQGMDRASGMGQGENHGEN